MEKIVASLFDFSFRRLVTPTLVRYIYIGSVVSAGFSALTIILGGFAQGFLSGFISLLIAPLFFLALVCLSRMTLETMLAIFRISSHMAEVARASRKAPSNSSRTNDNNPAPGRGSSSRQRARDDLNGEGVSREDAFDVNAVESREPVAAAPEYKKSLSTSSSDEPDQGGF